MPAAAMTTASQTVATESPMAPGRHLRARQVGALVDLDVGPQGAVALRDAPGHARDVALSRGLVQEQHRRGQLPHVPADRVPVGGLEPPALDVQPRASPLHEGTVGRFTCPSLPAGPPA